MLRKPSVFWVANYYRQFVGYVAHLTSNITPIVKKDMLSQGFHCDAQAKEAFVKCKHAFTQALILRHPNPSKKFTVETDAFDHAIGAVLFQLQDNDGLEHPIFYLSHILSDSERNSSLFKWELLTMKMACAE